MTLPPLPDSAIDIDRDVAAFFALVRGLRLTEADTRPVPFACEWIAAKLDLTKTAVWRARNHLVKFRVLVPQEPLPGRGKRGVDCYLPGACPPVDVLPPGASSVEADRPGAPHQHQEVGKPAAVLDAITGDGREVSERDGLPSAPVRRAPELPSPATRHVGPPHHSNVVVHGSEPTPTGGAQAAAQSRSAFCGDCGSVLHEHDGQRYCLTCLRREATS